ncbi:rRNA (cytosine-C5-)-methyltransferase nop2 [Neophaeococcomyces mojaviensis]|uniref:rRNA (Cytosine-C5-)-methyltransferase nop2 n=1 Tax=Neophaeococcomyces mojaviensis TaxID=3383035 RepID=A0ACC3AFN1_9EURO|nr:rRNA (cytosine-C5-)-methyltransferase nop2 [Knufia sp. JES_112]
MGVGNRMKKQGMPMSLEELGYERKRKNEKPQKGSSKKRKTSDDDEPKKLVNLDRAMRLERLEKKQVKEKKKKQKIANPDAQITVPPVLPVAADDDIEEDVMDDVEEVALDDAELNEASLSEDQLEELAAEELDDLEDASDSVFDSNEEGNERPKGMFSEDEDSDAIETLNAANIEGLSRKLDAEQAQIEAEAQQELEDEALQTNIQEESGLPDGPPQPTLAPDLAVLRTRITETIRILTNFAKLSDKSKSRAEYTDQLLADICAYYGYTPYLAEKLFSLFSPQEAFAFFEANETPRPVVLRTNTLRTNRRTLAQALINRGVVLEPVGKWSKVGLQVFESPVPLGATPEYLAGHYILQAASSFLPVMALAPQEHERVLDMAAAPGGKTTYISALMRNTGAIFANDANRSRSKGLIGNIHRLGCKNVIVCNYEAQKAFPKILGGFDRVLLDSPCSGTGVIGKDPSVKTSKNERDFLALPHMQKQLLLAAVDSVDHASKTGGYIVYSTCSVTVEENESVVQYVLRKRPNVQIADTGLGSFGTPGFTAYQSKKFDERMNLTRRYFPHRENVDGFFVCKLKKTGPTPTGAAANGQMNGTEKAEAVKVPFTNGVKPTTNGATDDEQAEIAPDDNFGGWNSDEDTQYLARAEKKWLKSKGLDPRIAEKKKVAKENGEAHVNDDGTAAAIADDSVNTVNGSTTESSSKKEKKANKSKEKALLEDGVTSKKEKRKQKKAAA